MTRLVLVEDRPGCFDEFRAGALPFVRAHAERAGTAVVHQAGSGFLTVDLALPGHAGFRCVTALGGPSSDIPVLAVLGCDSGIHETALGARLRTFVRRERSLRLAQLATWPSALGLPPREFDRLMSVVRRCGRLTTHPERQYLLNVRTVGFLITAGVSLDEHEAYSDAWHAVQLAIARDATSEHRAIA